MAAPLTVPCPGCGQDLEVHTSITTGATEDGTVEVIIGIANRDEIKAHAATCQQQ